MGRPRLNLTEEEKLERKKAKQKDREENKRGLTRKKWLAKHPEDQWLDDENQQARLRGWDNDGIRSLFAGICLKACIDYKKATQGTLVDGKDPNVTIIECREFFKGDIFQYFINRIPVEEVESMIKATPQSAIQNIWKKSEESQKTIVLD